jgi:hypothetical protein
LYKYPSTDYKGPFKEHGRNQMKKQNRHKRQEEARETKKEKGKERENSGGKNKGRSLEAKERKKSERRTNAPKKI